MKSSIITTTSDSISSGGTITGDLTIEENLTVSGDLTVSGGGSLSFDEILEGTQVIDVTNTEAFLVRKNSDGGDVFTIDTTNSIIKAGVDDTGVDVRFYSATASEGLLYDASEDELGLLLTTKLKFHDIGGGEEIYASSNGHLEINAGTTLDITAPTVDINASSAVTIDGKVQLTATHATNQGTALHLKSTGGHNWYLHPNGTTGNLELNYNDVVETIFDASGAVTFAGAVTVGADDQGYDVIFYGNTASSNMTWDTSEDDLVLNDSRLVIDQDDNALGIHIDSEATSEHGIYVTGKFPYGAIQDISGGAGIILSRNIAEAGSYPLVTFTDDHTSNTQPTLKIQQDGAGYGISIDQNGNQSAIYIDSESTSEHTIYIDSAATQDGRVLLINQCNALTTGSIIYAHSESSSTGTRNLVEIINDHASATGTTGLKIQQDAGGAVGAHIYTGSAGTITNLSYASELIIEADGGGGISIRTPDANSGNIMFQTASNDTVARILADYGSGSEYLAIEVDGSERMRINSSGNVGIGVTPETSHANYTSLQVGGLGNIINTTAQSADSYTAIVNNAYIDATPQWEYIVTDEASRYVQTGGIHTFSAVASGSADAAITWTDVFKLDINSRISLSNNDSGTSNTIFGYNAGASFSANNNNNVVIGHNALDAADGTEGSNIAIGENAMSAVDEGSHASATGDDNVAIGYNALLGGSFGSSNLQLTGNIAIGSYALDATGTSASTGTIAIGYQALTAQTADSSSVAIGYQAGLANQTGSRNVIIGYQSGITATDIDNAVLVGYQAGNAINANGGDATVAIGYQALTALTSGAGNVAIGYQSLDAEDTGDYNTAIGYMALSAQDDGDLNTAVGYEAGLSHTTGGSGWGGNTFIGAKSGKYNGAGRGNTFVGSESAQGNSGAVLTGSYNTAVGVQSGLLLQGAGHENTFVGGYSGDVLTTGSDNTCIGYGADTDDATAINQTVIGHSTTGLTDNSVTLGNASVTDVYMAQDSGAYVHSQNVPNHVANTMSAPYYRFAGGQTEKIDCGAGTNFPTGDFTYSCWVYMDTLNVGHIGGNYGTGSTNGIQFSVNASGIFSTYIQAAVNSTTGISAKTWNHVAYTRSGTAVTIYVNGVSDGTGTNANAIATTGNFYIGAPYDAGNANESLTGQIAGARIYNNALTATEVKELYSGASVPFKYKGGSQTQLAGAMAGQTARWNNNGLETFSYSGNDLTAAAETGSFGVAFNGDATYPLTPGKRYRIEYTLTLNSGTAPFIRADASTNLPTGAAMGLADDIVASAGFNSHEITAVGSCYIGFRCDAASNFEVTNWKVYRLGAVAEYDGSSAGVATWYDNSGNSLDGTVSGATLENANAVGVQRVDDTTGAVTMPEQPAFLVNPASQQANPGNNAEVAWGTEIFDQGANFASNTFTAPVTGKYQFNVHISTTGGFDTASDYHGFNLITSNRTYQWRIDPDLFDSAGAFYTVDFSVLADMDASDTALIQHFESGGTVTLDIETTSYFSGFLVC